MKVHELLESQVKLSQDEIKALPEPNAKNIDDRYRVGMVAFDNAKGIGAVPNNQEVKYFGFAMEISPPDFTKLAAQAERGDSALKIFKLIQDGVPLGAPFLNVHVNYEEFKKGDPLRLEVIGHEGRARSLAIHHLVPDVKIPVHVFPRPNLRAHDLDEEFFKQLRSVGIIPEKKTIPIHIHIGKIFWMGKAL